MTWDAAGRGPAPRAACSFDGRCETSSTPSRRPVEDVVAAELTADHLSVPGGIGLELEQLRSDQHLDRARTVRVLGGKEADGGFDDAVREPPRQEVAGADELAAQRVVGAR